MGASDIAGRLVEALRTGAWLTRERIRRIALAVLAASALGLIFIAVTSDGLNDYQGRPLGTDFSNVYAAGSYVLDGRAAAPFDPPQQAAREKAIFGEDTQFYGWHYPPFFLFVAAALALMPYWLALLVWQGATLALYVWAMRVLVASFVPPPGSPAREAIGDPLWLLLVLAYPAVFVNIGHGHNGFLTAALLTGALVLLDRRPLLAGVMFGLLAYKPQFGLMIPLVLVASGRWRACAAATATVAALVIVTTLVFGADIWRAALASTAFTREVVLEQGNTGWHKIQSVFSWVRMWGGAVPAAYVMQSIVTAGIAGLLVWLWRSDAAYPLKAAALCLATILATPYSLDYDLVVIAPALAFLVVHGLCHGFAPHEKSALALAWIMPLIAPAAADAALIPLGVMSLLLLLLLLVRRAGPQGLPAADPVR